MARADSARAGWHGIYGAPRIQLEPRDDHGVGVGGKRVARLMGELGIEGVSRRGKKRRSGSRNASRV